MTDQTPNRVQTDPSLTPPDDVFAPAEAPPDLGVLPPDAEDATEQPVEERPSPLGNYVRELQQEFVEQEEEAKLFPPEPS